MARNLSVSAVAFLLAVAAPSPAAPIAFKEAVVTEAVNQVDLLSANAQRPAKIQDKVQGNDVVRTGTRSRAELKFPDSTVARVGANAAFSFRPDTRGVDLQKGSILFHSPKGLGGGQIRTAAATASVLGTTIIVSATKDGGFKVLVLEGKAKVQSPNGRTVVLKAGEMTFVLIKNGSLSPALTFRLNQQVQDSQLINGFAATLPSLTKIGEAIKRQETLIGRGLFDPTRFLIGQIRNGENLELLDPNSTPQNTDPLRRFDDAVAHQLFLDFLARYSYMLHRPALVAGGRLDPRHVIWPQELNHPIAFEAFKIALAAAGPRPRGIDPAVPGFDIVPAPQFGFSPLQAGFVARGIAFNDATVHLGAFTAAQIFTFLSLADIAINGDLEIGGFRGIADFHAVHNITFSPESTIRSLSPGLSMVFASAGPLSLNTVNFELPGGFLGLASGQSIDINSGSWMASDGLRIAARGPVSISDLSLNGSPYVIGGMEAIANNAIDEFPPPLFSFPQVNIFAGGPISIANSDFGNAELLAVTPDTLSIDGSFNARGIDAIAGTIDVDFWNLSYLNFAHLTQIDDWFLSAVSCYPYNDLALGSFGALTLYQVALGAQNGVVLSGRDVFVDYGSTINSSGNFGSEGVTIDSDGKLYFLGNSSINSGNRIEFRGMDIRIQNAALTVAAADPLHAITVRSGGGLGLIDSTLSSSGPIFLHAKDFVKIGGGSLTAGTFSPSPPNNINIIDAPWETIVPDLIHLTAGNRLDVYGTALNASNIRLQAITIALRDINFLAGSRVVLRSGNGLLAPNPNSNQEVRLGFVNYIDNVRYDDNLLLGPHPNISIKKIP